MQVREMPLGQFTSQYGSDINAVMLEDIKRLAAPQANSLLDSLSARMMTGLKTGDSALTFLHRVSLSFCASAGRSNDCCKGPAHNRQSSCDSHPHNKEAKRGR